MAHRRHKAQADSTVGPPGTVSRILWHFTGGPDWDADRERQKSSPKPVDRAYSNLVSILQARELQLGGYKEVVRVVIPHLRVFSAKTRRITVKKNVAQKIASESVCCLSDIPAPHLGYHANRYGKIALGFHREAALRSSFNPVFYTLETSAVIQSIYDGFTELEFIDMQPFEEGATEISRLAESIQGAAMDLDNEEGDPTTIGDSAAEIDTYASDLVSEATATSEPLENARVAFRRFLAFVKTFSSAELSTIYCEREWRSTRKFEFSLDDVAMIVLPRKLGARRYHEDFIKSVASKLEIPRTIPVVPWEELVEH